MNTSKLRVDWLTANWARFVLRWEEQLYFEHDTDVPREICAFLFKDFHYCPECGNPLNNTHWMNHDCDAP